MFDGCIITENITLTAKWTPTVYTIKYYLNGSINSDNNVISFTIDNLPIVLHAPEKDNSVFNGWFTDELFENEITEITEIGNYEIYAKWYDATKGLVYTLTESGYEITGYFGTAIDVYIPALYDGIPVTSIASSAFSKKTDIKSVHIADGGVSDIGADAFSGCSGMEKLYIGTNVSSMYVSSFKNCTGLTEIIYNSKDCTLNSVGGSSFGSFASAGAQAEGISLTFGKDVVNIPSALFRSASDSVTTGAANIVSVAFEEGSKCQSIGANVFNRNTNIQSVTLSDSIKTIGANAFYSCSSLESINIPTSLTSLGSHAFYGCTSLESNIVIPSGTVSNYAFYNCSSITSIEFANGVTAVGGNALYGCSSLTEIILPKTVTSIGSSAFAKCSAAKEIHILNKDATIDAGAFNGCSSLEKLTVSSTGKSISASNVTTTYNFGYYFGTTSYDNSVAVTQEVRKSNSSTTTQTVYYLPASLSSIKILGEINNRSLRNCTMLQEVEFANGVTAIGQYAFENCIGLESITIPSSVISIGSYAFNGCTQLKEVSIPVGVESIGAYAFQNCSNMESVEISNSIKTIEQHAFAGCSGLTNVVIPNNVTSIGAYAFQNCSNIESVTISSGITEIKPYTFSGCSELSSAKIPSGVTIVGDGAFSNCSSMTSIEIPNSVTTIKASALNNCSSLTEVVVPSSVTSIGSAVLGGCSSLEKLTIPFVGSSIKKSSETYQYPLGYIFGQTNYDGAVPASQTFYQSSTTSLSTVQYYIPATLEKVTVNGGDILYGSFKSCANIKSITVPSTATQIGAYSFNGCSMLESITIPSGVTSIGSYAFGDCISLEEINYNANNVRDLSGSTIVFKNAGTATSGATVNIGKNVSGIPAYLFYVPSTSISPKIKTVVFEEDSACQKIGDFAFARISALESINIPNVTSIGASAFSDCSKLKNIKIPNSVTSIGTYAFNNCSSIEAVVIPTGVTIINDYTFSGCNSLTSATILGNVSSICTYAFNGCKSLEEIEIPNSAKSIGTYAFSGCSSLTSIKLSSNTDSIGSYAFSGCSSLEEIKLPSALKTIGSSAFSGCSTLTEVDIPSGVTSVGSAAFNGCSSLEKIAIPFTGGSAKTTSSTYQYPFGYIFGTSNYDGAIAIGQKYYGSSTSTVTTSTYYIPTSLKEITIHGGNILYGAFYGCSLLKSVTIGENVSTISNAAFYGCTSIERINYNATSMSVSSNGQIFYNAGITGDGIVLNISNNVTVIPSYLFYISTASNQPRITNVVFEEESVCTSIGSYAFTGANRIESIELPSTVTSIGSYAFKDCTNLQSINIPNGVTDIKANTFQNCNTLTSIEIPNSVTSIGSYAFSGCSSLASIKLSSNTDSIGSYAFKGCSSLEEIKLPSTLKTIGSYAFSGCSILTEVDIPSSVTSVGSAAFNGCSSLEKIAIPFVGGSVKSTSSTYQYPFGYIFGTASYDGAIGIAQKYYGSSTSSVSTTTYYIPSSLTEVTVAGGAILYGAFYGCSLIERVTIGENVTYIANNAFYNCTSLNEFNYNAVNASVNSSGQIFYNAGITDDGIAITIGNNVITVPAYLFYGKATANRLKVTSVEFEENSACKRIGAYAFAYLSLIESIEIPSSVETIGDYAFYECNNLTIYCEATTQPDGWNSSWNYSNRPVVWGHVHAYENGECVCGMKQD